MSQGMIAIEGRTVACRPRSDATDPNDRLEENLVFGARDTLEDVVRLHGILFMLKALPAIAEFYGVDSRMAVEHWSMHYGANNVADLERWLAERKR